MDSSIQTGCWGETSVIWHTTPTSKLAYPSPPDKQVGIHLPPTSKLAYLPPNKQAGIPLPPTSKLAYHLPKNQKKIRLKTFNICHLWHDRLIIQPGTLTITSRKTDRIPA